MSVVVTLCLYDGIVMAADSRATLIWTYPDGKQEVSHRDGEKKIYQFGDRNIGISWCGNALVGNENVPDYLNGLFNRLNKMTTIKEIAEKINEECNERLIGGTMRCHIAGYENGTQCFYQVVDGVVTHKNINPERGIPTICIVWDGIRGISRDIIRGKEKLDIGDRLVDESDIPHFTLDEGVRFTRALLKRSCLELEECGEPLYSLTITDEGIHWIG
ncbi:hypothetical protein [Clostridium sp. HBUAS56010]|uniref:hypothetical protein n=1 Tax=Clostridium sp. HBUAS56010 TaxID=2571127 RepID=UPI001177E592|nr:hypothetical protein [Clostridium sp. HBUAS56010]